MARQHFFNCKSVVVDVTTLLQVVITLHEVDISLTLYSMFLQLATPVSMLFNLQVITMLCYSLKENAACISHPLFVVIFYVFLHVNGLTVMKTKGSRKKKT